MIAGPEHSRLEWLRWRLAMPNVRAWLLAPALVRGLPSSAAPVPMKCFETAAAALTEVPNCYAFAMGVASRSLGPGLLAARAGLADQLPVGTTPARQRRMFALDGLRPMRRRDLRELPPGAWVVSLHQRLDLDGCDFHLRRLDSAGWSEKRGNYPPAAVEPKNWRSLLRAKAETGRYRFTGFFVVDPSRWPLNGPGVIP